MKDSFARASATRAWKEARELTAEVRELRRQFELAPSNHCHYCGAPAVGTVCYAHSWTLVADQGER